MKNLILSFLSIVLVSLSFGQCNITDQTVSINQSNFICSGSTTVDLGSSETGVDYFLRDDANDLIIDGPVAGTGAPISLSTGLISGNTTYNVYASQDGPSIGLDFDGVDDFVELSGGTAGITSSSFTMEFWVNLPSQSAGTIYSLNSSSYADKFAIYISGSNIFVAEGFSGASGSTVVADGQWHHVAVICDGTDTHVYVDFNFDFTATGIAPTFLASDVAALGQDYDSGPVTSSHLTGSLDNIRFWNSIRTINEMQQDAQICPDPLNGFLAAYYDFEDGTGSSTLTDLTNNNYDGTLVNMDPATDWIAGGGSCSDCQTEMSTLVSATVSPINDQSLTASTTTICDQGSATIDIASSDVGVEYYLRDDATNAVIDGPYTGTGSALTFNTGNLTTTTTFNVFARKGGTAVNFDSPNETIEIDGLSLGGLSAFTIEAWIKPDAISAEHVIAANYDYAATNALQYVFSIKQNGELYASLSTSNGFATVTSAAGTISTGAWQHVAYVYDGTELKLFLNGTQLAATSPQTGGVQSSIHGTFIGSANSSGRWYDGAVDDIRFWAVPRSANDIQNDLNSCLAGSETGLLHYYSFGNGSGYTVPDNTGSLDGQMLGMEVSDWVVGSNTCECSSEMTSTVTINVGPEPELTLVGITDVLCNGDQTGAIDISFNGQGNNAFDWDNDGWGDNDDTEDLSTVGAGTYAIVATDGIGCDDTLTGLVITEPSPLVVSLVSTTDEINGNDGEIDIDVTGGTGNYTYDWDNDGTGDNDDTQDLSGLTGGTYTVIVTDDNGCTETLVVNVSSQVGIAQQSEGMQINVYPNPTSGEFFIDLGENPSETVFVEVIDAVGQRIYQSSQMSDRISIDVSDRESGVYFIRTTIGDQVSTMRLLKQ